MNSSVAAAWEMMLSDADPLEVAKAAEAVIGFCHAQQLQAFHQLFDDAELGADPDGLVVDPTGPEVACAMAWTPGAASVMVDTAVDVVAELPQVWHALADGQIDLAKVKEISRGTCELQPAPTGRRWPTKPFATPPVTPADSYGRGWPATSTGSTPTPPNVNAAAPANAATSGSPPTLMGWPRSAPT